MKFVQEHLAEWTRTTYIFMYKKLILSSVIIVLCVGCSSLPASAVATPTNTPTKESFVTTESIPTLRPKSLSPCSSRELVEITPTYQDNRIDQVQLQTEFAGRVEFNSDSTKIFLNTSQGIYVLNASDAQLLCVMPNENAFGYGMAISHDSSLLALMDIYGKITLMDANTGIASRVMQATPYQSQSRSWVEFNDDSSLLVSWGQFEPVKVWDTKSGQAVLETLGRNATISPNGKFLALRNSNYMQIIDILNKAVLVTKVDEKTEPDFLYLLFSRDGNYLYGLNVYSEIKVWDVHTGEIVHIINPCPDCTGYGWEIECPRMTLSADGTKLLLVDPIQISLWNTQTWEKIMSENNFNNHPLFDASISPDGKKIIVTFQGDDPIRFFYLD